MEKFNISTSEIIRAYVLLRSPKGLKEEGVLYRTKLQHPFHHLRTKYVTNGREYALSTDIYAHNGLFLLEPHIFKNIFPLSRSTKLVTEKDFEVVLDETNYLTHANVKDLANRIHYNISVSQDLKKLSTSIEKKLEGFAEYSTKLNISTGFEDGRDLVGETRLNGMNLCFPYSLDRQFDKNYVSYLHFIETVISGIHEDLFSYKEESIKKSLEKLFPIISLKNDF